MSSYLGINEARQTLEIGGTYYRPQLAAPASTGGSRHDDAPRLRLRNPPRRISRRPPQRPQPGGDEKLGAVREGVLRADRITWTGHVRDTVLFAILKDEWPV